MAPPLRLLCARSLLWLAPALLALGALLVVRQDNAPRTRAGSSDELAAATSRADALELERQKTLRRFAARREVIEEVIAGRLSVDEAARRFCELNATLPEVNQEALRAYIEAATDEERSRKQVMAWVRAELGERDPSDRAASVGDLEQNRR